MRLSTTKHDKYVILKIEEEKLTSAIAPQLKSDFVVLLAEGRANIIIDMSDVQYADSSGLSALLQANRMCEASGGIFLLVSLTSHVQKLIKISQLDRVLTILPTKQEGIEAVFLHEIEKDIEESDEDDLGNEIASEFSSLDGYQDSSEPKED